MVRGLAGVVEGNHFAENAREWSPRGTKIKTVFNFRSTGIFGARHGRTLFGPAYFFVSTPPYHNSENSSHFDTPLGGFGRGSLLCFVAPRFFFDFFWQIIWHFRPELSNLRSRRSERKVWIGESFTPGPGRGGYLCRQYIVNRNNRPNFIYF